MAIKSQGSILNQYIPPFCLDSPVDGEMFVYDKDEKAWTNQKISETVVTSVFGRAGDVVASSLDYAEWYATVEQGDLAATAIQPGDNVSLLANDAGYLTSATETPAPVDSVFGRTGVIVPLATDYLGVYALSIHQHTESDITNLDKYSQAEVDAKDAVLQTGIDGKAPLVHTHVELDITDLDKYTKAEIDALTAEFQDDIDGKAPIIHAHLESQITNLDKYSQVEVDFKFATTPPIAHTHIKTDIVDFSDSDYATAAQGTKADSALQTLTSESIGSLGDVDLTDIADGKILKWLTNTFVVVDVADSTAIWGEIEGTLANQTDLQAALDNKANTVHTHTESDIINLDKYTQAEIDTQLAGKAESVHTHLEAQITDLDKYDQNTVDTKLAGKTSVVAPAITGNLVSLDAAGSLLDSGSKTADFAPTNHTHTTYQLLSEKSAQDGYASLDGTGKVPIGELPDSIQGGLTYKGLWDAATNTPTLTSSVGAQGDFYIVEVAGSTDLDGYSSWIVGDRLAFNGTIWERFANSQTVISVFGREGAVVAVSGDYTSALVSYDNATTGLVAVDVQAAIDEIDGRIDTNETNITTLQGDSHTHSNKIILDTIVDSGSGSIITATERTSIGTATHPGDNVSDLVNDAGYLTSAPASPIDSVFGRTGEVIADSADYAAFYAPLVHQHVEADITNLDKYTQAEVDAKDAVLQTAIDGKAPTVHTHIETDITDLDKYTQATIDTKFATTPPIAHTHVEVDITDLNKYTRGEVDNLFAITPPIAYTHIETDITDLDKYTQVEVDVKDAVLQTAIDGKAPTVHTHIETDITDLDKYTQAEVDSKDATLQSAIDGKAPTVHAHVETDITNLDKYTQVEVDAKDTVLQTAIDGKAPTVHSHVETDITDLNRVRWGGNWNSTLTYNKNDMVLDDPWTMIANKTTVDPAAPFPSGAPTWTMETSPTFVTDQNESVVHSGHIYTMSKSGWIERIRVWVPKLSSTTNYRFVFQDITDPGNPIRTIINDPLLFENTWTEIVLTNVLIRAGAILKMYIDALDSGEKASITGGWTYTGTSNNAAPTTGHWIRNSNHTNVRIHKTDLDGTSRASELEGVTIESTIAFSQTNDVSKGWTYEVTGVPIDRGDYMEYPVVRTANLNSIDTGAITTMNINIPVAQPTQYVSETNTWAIQPDFATVEGFLDFSGSPVAGNELNGFGVDVRYQEASVSEDWEVVSTIGSGVLGSQPANNSSQIISEIAESEYETRIATLEIQVEDLLNKL